MEDKGKSDYSTVDLRKHLRQALGRAHYQNDVVKISHHGKPYARVVSEGDGAFVEELKARLGEHYDEFRINVTRLINRHKSLDELVAQLERATESADMASRSRANAAKDRSRHK